MIYSHSQNNWDIFSFSIVSLHQKWDETRLLSPGTKYTSNLTSCWGLRKFQENLKMQCIHLAIALEGWTKPAVKLCIKKFHSWYLQIIPKVLCNDCLRKQNSILNSVQTLWNITFLQILVSLKPLKAII